MVEQVISEIGKRTSRLAPNLFGTGLPEQIRTTVVAMVGFTAAAGLALVFFISQTTWQMPSLGPLSFPPPGQAGLHDGVALGTAGAKPASTSRSSATAAGGASLAVVVPVAAGAPAAPTGSSPGDLGGSAPGVHQGQGASGGSQPATPSPGSPVNGSGTTPEDEATAPESSPGSTPVSVPTTSPEAPAVPAGEELPVIGEPPSEVEEPVVEEPPVEEPEEGGEGEGEAESEQLRPGSGLAGVLVTE